DPAIRAVIPDEFLQNPNAWQAKVALINYATVEMHRSDKVLRQLGCRQPIPVEPEFEYIQMWEDRYDYIPSIEPIIVLELACLPEYMPWFRIHGKPYLLSPEERQRQLRVQKERSGPLNPRRQDDDAGLSMTPRHSPGPMRAPTQSPDPAVQPMIPTQPPFQGPVQLHFLLRRVDRRCKGQRRTTDRKRDRRGALLFTNPHHHMGFKHRRRW
ncbi:hypothetical protein Gotur_035693, partial [Gossypium turneri]